MKNQFHAETAKLSLVGKHSHAINFSQSKDDNQDIEYIAARLPAVLQTSLELDDVIGLFDKEINKILPYDSLHYQHQGVHCDISTANRSHHSCNYRLEMNNVWLGELTLTRRTKFSDTDLQLLEDLLCKLIYPVRNCLLFRQAQNAALEDKLTGLNNRGAFDTCLKREIDFAHRQHMPMSLIVLDIDNFKIINDTHGHSSGDSALRLLAKSITETMRASDIAFRYGGEEFSLILSNTDSKSAHLLAERLRIAASSLICSDGKLNYGFSISLGVAQLNRGEQGSSLFDRADHALYQAKKSGRNVTVCSPSLISNDN
jgi:diguanylate cyclase (GGDEF)-like protein